jgi:hypothetical protein
MTSRGIAQDKSDHDDWRETPAIRAAARQGNASGFLVKPFDDEAFLLPSRRRHKDSVLFAPFRFLRQ